MRAVVVVVVLPLLQLLGEEVGVVDDLALEESVELFGVDAVGGRADRDRTPSLTCLSQLAPSCIIA